MVVCVWVWICAASLKNIGEKTAGLFDRKKREMGDLAAEKAAEAQTYAGEQAQKAGELLDGAGEFFLSFNTKN